MRWEGHPQTGLPSTGSELEQSKECICLAGPSGLWGVMRVYGLGEGTGARAGQEKVPMKGWPTLGHESPG